MFTTKMRIISLRHFTIILIFPLCLLFCSCSDSDSLKTVPRPNELPAALEWQNRYPDYWGVFFFDSTAGWAAGEGGTILATTDGGKTWTSQRTKVEGLINAIYFVNRTIGWAVTENGKIIATADGGKTWDIQADDTKVPMHSIYFVNETEGWATGDSGTILATTNGGRSWDVQESRTGYSLESLHFINPTTGWAVGGGGTIIATTNGGKLWNIQPIENDTTLNGVWFVNATTGWAVGDDGLILSTTDGGAKWVAQKSNANTFLKSISFVDSQTGWAVGGNGTILTTSNGGQDWTSQNSRIKAHLYSVCFTDSKTGWAVGALGNIVTTADSGGSWTISHQGSAITDHLNSIYFADAENGWVVGDNSTIAITTDGGKTWRPQTADVKAAFQCVRFVNSKFGWAVGSGGIIVATSDKGEKWAKQNTPTKNDLQGAFFANSVLGWAVGDNGTIIATTDGGDHWSSRSSGLHTQLQAIYFADLKHGWIVGSNGTILVSTDGGDSWGAQQSGTTDYLYGIHFVSPTTGWVVGQNGKIIATTDGGTTWSNQSSGTQVILYSVTFRNALSGWVVGREGTIATTNNGGEKWIVQNVGFKRPLFAIHFINDWTGFAVGGLGKLIDSRKIGSAAYVKKFGDSSQSDNVELNWQVEDEEPSTVSCTRVEFRRGNEGTWDDIHNLAISSDGKGNFQARWNPGSSHYVVADGTAIYYRVTLLNNHGVAFRHEIPIEFLYHPWWERQSTLAKTAIIIIGIASAYFGICFLLLYLTPMTLFRFYSALRPQESLPALIENKLVKYSIEKLLTLTFLPLFVTSDRTRAAWLRTYELGKTDFGKLDTIVRSNFIRKTDVLDAWVEKRRKDGLDALNRISTVNQRKFYIPLPLRFGDSQNGRLFTEPKPVDFREICEPEDKRMVITVVGGGGTGKTTLACQLARWAADQNPKQRLTSYSMIPVFIEEETTDLLETITSRLKRMVGDQDIDHEIVLNLLRTKRLLVIVDSLSERSSQMQRLVQSIHGTLPINAMIVTSRQTPDFGEVDVAQLWLQGIDINKLIYFLNEYLRLINADAYFPGRQALRLGDRFMALVEGGGPGVRVTPLLVKLFVDNAIARIRSNPQELLDGLPLSIPETMLDYLRGLNPGESSTADRVTNIDIISAARELANCSLGAEYVPREFYRDNAEKALKAVGLNGNVIDRLIGNGLIEEHDPGSIKILRFSIDPIAEYLAALYWLNKLRNDEQEWTNWLNCLPVVAGFPESLRGFLEALDVCIKTYQVDLKIPKLRYPFENLLHKDEAA